MKRVSIVKQTIDRLNGMAAWGQSKHQDKLVNHGKPALEKIYSHSTMDNYRDASVNFAKWARDTHSCRDIDQARQYTGEFLKQRMEDGKSAWTVHRDASALAKLYQTQTNNLGADLPTRHRGDVTQHRGDKSKGHFSESKNRELVDFCKATGLRRHEVAALRPEDVQRHADGSVTVHVLHGKGGKERTVTALNDYPAKLAAQAAAAGQTKLIEHIVKYAPIHEYRAEFAREMYHRIARDIETIPRNETYHCRADQAGTAYDKHAMKEVSLALGHSRLDVVTSYMK